MRVEGWGHTNPVVKGGTEIVVLITGAAGYLGFHLAKLLLGRGHRVRCLFRAHHLEEEGPLLEELGAELAVGDVRDLEFLREAVKGVDCVVHLAALLPPRSEENEDLTFGINVQGTANLLDVTPEGVAFIFASSVATYGVPRQEIVSTDHPQNPLDFYSQTKLRNEKDIIASQENFTILRISGISIPAVLEIPAPWPFMKDQKMEYVHLDDAVIALANCVGNEEVRGRIFNIAGGDSWRMLGEDYSEAICRAFDIPPSMARFPDEPGWTGWYDTSSSQAVLRYQSHTFEEYISELWALYLEAIGAA